MTTPTIRTRVTLPSDREFRTERTFDAPRDRVWRALTDPALVTRWWGRGHQLDIERLEVTRGGYWRFVEHADGTTHGFEGRFREVTPPGRMVQTFSWDGMPGHVLVQTIVLEELPGGQTRIITTALFPTTEERDGMISSGMEGGLNESYAALDRVLAGLK